MIWHAILYDLVGTFPQYQYQINESDPRQWRHA